ncbi:hypothetical protein ACJX0J_006819, partial [Zea mays]
KKNRDAANSPYIDGGGGGGEQMQMKKNEENRGGYIQNNLYKAIDRELEGLLWGGLVAASVDAPHDDSGQDEIVEEMNPTARTEIFQKKQAHADSVLGIGIKEKMYKKQKIDQPHVDESNMMLSSFSKGDLQHRNRLKMRAVQFIEEVIILYFDQFSLFP